MFDYSVLDSQENESAFAWEPPFSKDYKVYIKSREIPVYSDRFLCRKEYYYIIRY